MDEFKKYLNEHRDKLDTDMPGDHVWESLRKELEPSKGLVIPMIIKWAAAACVILLAGFGAYVLIVKDPVKEEVARTETPVQTDSVPKTEEKPQPSNEALNEQRSIAVIENPVRKQEQAPAIKEDKAVAKNGKVAAEKTDSRRIADPLSKAFNDMNASYASMVTIQLEKIKGTPIYAEDANYFHVFKKQFQDLNNDEKLLKDETKKNGINDDIITRMINIYQEKITLLKQLQFEINKMNNRVKNSETDVQKQTPTYINL
jgi:hypothetical protein